MGASRWKVFGDAVEGGRELRTIMKSNARSRTAALLYLVTTNYIKMQDTEQFAHDSLLLETCFKADHRALKSIVIHVTRHQPSGWSSFPDESARIASRNSAPGDEATFRHLLLQMVESRQWLRWPEELETRTKLLVLSCISTLVSNLFVSEAL